MGAGNVIKMVKILPVSEVVNTNEYFFKLDVQGFEFQVLKGAYIREAPIPEKTPIRACP